MILMIDNYDSFTYNLVQYLGELGENLEVYRNDKLTINKIKRMKPDHIVISPGPGQPKDAGISEDIIREFAGKVPILGVCLGHQAIGEVYGGQIIRAERLMHGKTSTIYHNGKTIFKGIPNPFEATRYHSLLVKRSSFPKCLEIIAETKQKEVMGLKHKKLPVWGVQFHPESILTTEGKNILANFLKISSSLRAPRSGAKQSLCAEIACPDGQARASVASLPRNDVRSCDDKRSHCKINRQGRFKPR